MPRPDFSASLGLTRSLLIYYGQPWRRSSLKRFYADLVRKGDLVFDIGAHAGSRSRTLLSLGARIVALEPQPLFADFIARSFAGEELTLLRKAVGKEPGSVDLHISSRHPTVTSISSSWISKVEKTSGFRNVTWDRVERVEMTTLDALIEEYGLPAFCKIDVEGAEADIIAGQHHQIPLIAFEYIPATMEIAEEAIGHLRKLGPYRFNRVEGERHRFVHDEWITADAMLAKIADLAGQASSGDIYARLET
ncbi:FkbM family methyltransferase [Neorhizobium galegae]|uniref:Methyltransferase FkbM family n=1 Tax=Neorhizobium galegae bv. officinalis TaxID=323656 RepID=A0A0T7GVS4_NEOGA|nr:FkbM family methyltransferase [Neorhizobium galegae]CDZ51227.1 Methyltransferase FkbM family [Neorhizobium galegae bv. officinalis]